MLLVQGIGCEPNPMRMATVRDEKVYEELPGLRASEHPELRAELLRLVEERATPALLGGGKVPPERNAALPLVDLFAEDELEVLLTQTRELASRGGLPLVGDDLKRGRTFLQRYAAQRARALEALNRPECDLALDHTAGAMLDLSPVFTLRIGARLEAFAASDALEKCDVARTIRSIDAMLRYAACLAGEKNIVARMEGAYVRAEALGIVNFLLHGCEASDSDLEMLYRLVARELASWPDDAEPWIGDRAMGLHTYEVIRDGHVLLLLDDEEEQELRREGLLRGLQRADADAMDRDELFYLQAMRRIIDGCPQPFHQRRAALADIRQQIHQVRGTEDEPVVASRLLLNDVERGQYVQAHDRALCEAWALALARLAGLERPPLEINPLTGTPYEIGEQEGLLMVRPIEGHGTGVDAVIVPLPQHETQ